MKRKREKLRRIKEDERRKTGETNIFEKRIKKGRGKEKKEGYLILAAQTSNFIMAFTIL